MNHTNKSHSIFEPYGDRNTCLIIQTEWGINDLQTSKIEEEILEEFRVSKCKLKKLTDQFFESITHNNFGSLIAIFYEDVLSLDYHSQNQIFDTAYGMILESDVMISMFYLEEIESMDKVDFDETTIGSYMDHLLNAQYNIHMDEIRHCFKDRVPECVIEKEYLIRMIKYPNRCFN